MHIRKAEITSPITSFGEDGVRIMPVALAIGAGGLAGGAFLAGPLTSRFMHSYLFNFCFFCSISLGCLFFVLVQHLTRAGWSVTVRRIAEIFAVCIFPLFILFIPVLLAVFMGNDLLYDWNSSVPAAVVEAKVAGEAPDWAANDWRIFDLKTTFLDNIWYVVRSMAYFGVWIVIAFYMYYWSTKQDETGDARLTSKMAARAAPMMLLFVMALVFASFDWEMSLAPMWFSTMFPVYFFAGAVMSSLASITLAALLLQRSGRITDEITVEHYHDLAKLTFAFVFFWGYIAFSQFMLIWYANMPEETFWFKLRADQGWLTLTMILLFGHLFIPFMLMMARTVRRSKAFLIGSSIYLLAMHWLDHFWIVMPQLYANMDEFQLGEQTMYTMPTLVDGLIFVGMLGVMIGFFCLISGNRSLIPLKDPRLHEALNYDNP